jgi:hypothetical protein
MPGEAAITPLLTADTAPEQPRATPSIPHLHIPGLGFLYRAMGTSLLFFVLLALGLAAAGIFYGHKMYLTQLEMKADQEALKANFRVLNERTIIGDIIDESLPKLPPDTRSRITQEIYDMGRRYGIPYHIALSMFAHESTWTTDRVSSKGAVGLGQVMPETAYFVAKAEGVPFTLDMLRDPVINARWSMITLGMKHEISVMQGKSNREDWVQALWYYSGKGEAYARLVISESVPYKKRLDAPLQGKISPALANAS